MQSCVGVSVITGALSLIQFICFACKCQSPFPQWQCEITCWTPTSVLSIARTCSPRGKTTCRCAGTSIKSRPSIHKLGAWRLSHSKLCQTHAKWWLVFVCLFYTWVGWRRTGLQPIHNRVSRSLFAVSAPLLRWDRAADSYSQTYVLNVQNKSRMNTDTRFSVSLSTRIAVIIADVIVLLVTWYETGQTYMEARRLKISTPLVALLLRDGLSHFLLLDLLHWLTYVFAGTAYFAWVDILDSTEGLFIRSIRSILTIINILLPIANDIVSRVPIVIRPNVTDYHITQPSLVNLDLAASFLTTYVSSLLLTTTISVICFQTSSNRYLSLHPQPSTIRRFWKLW